MTTQIDNIELLKNNYLIYKQEVELLKKMNNARYFNIQREKIQF